MDDALRWRLRFGRPTADDHTAKADAPARSGGSGDHKPVLIAIVHGPVEVEMAQAVLSDEAIPALVKRRQSGPSAISGVSLTETAEVWVPIPLVERARDALIGVGLLDPDADATDGNA